MSDYSKYLGLFIVGVMALLAGCGSPTEQKPLRTVITQTVQVSSVMPSRHYDGNIHSRYETALGFRVAGKIKRRLVDLGDSVTKGQLLAELDDSDRQLAVAAAKAQRKAAYNQYMLAKRQFDRAESLFERHLISQSTIDQRKTQLDISRSQWHQADKQFEIKNNQLDYTRLYAHHDGTITAINADPGEVVAAGQPVLVLARQGNYDVWIDVPESQIDVLKPKQQATISFWAQPDTQVSGKIHRIASAANPITGTFRVKVALDSLPEGISLGMNARVQFTNKVPPAIRLPLSSLFHQGKTPAVWVLQEHKLKLVPVEVVRYTNTQVVLAANGALKTGDQVVIKGVHKLNAKMKVVAQSVNGDATNGHEETPDE